MTPRVVVVGASLAGARLVKALRRRAFAGEIVLVGEEPELPYDRPPLSKGFLADPEATAPKLLEPPEFYDGVRLLLGRRATGLRLSDRRVTLDDGSAVVADHVVVATGATPRELPGVPFGDRVAPLRTIEDARRVQAAFRTGGSLLVVGAGFIGCEVAAAARARGIAVTVVEPLAAPVVRGIGHRVGAVVADLHREHGVDLRLSTAVTRIVADDDGVVAELSDGTTVRAGFAVVGVGARAQTDWLDGSGLDVVHGVRCDARGRAVGGGGQVWAVGDVAAWPSARYGHCRRVEHWTSATEHAAVVAAGIMGAQVADHDPVPYVWSDQYGHKLQILGSVSGEDRTELLHGDPAARRFVVGYLRDGRWTGAVACDMPTELAKLRPALTSVTGLRERVRT